jgi:hypothetical protein
MQWFFLTGYSFYVEMFCEHLKSTGLQNLIRNLNGVYLVKSIINEEKERPIILHGYTGNHAELKGRCGGCCFGSFFCDLKQRLLIHQKCEKLIFLNTLKTALCCRVSSLNSCQESVMGEKSSEGFPENSLLIPKEANLWIVCDHFD